MSPNVNPSVPREEGHGVAAATVPRLVLIANIPKVVDIPKVVYLISPIMDREPCYAR
jgi:hypothetical protein